jgi:hypothetical protein
MGKQGLALCQMWLCLTVFFLSQTATIRLTAFIFRSILFPVELSGCWQRLPADLARLIVMTSMTGSAYSSSSHRVLGRVIVQVMLTALF